MAKGNTVMGYGGVGRVVAVILAALFCAGTACAQARPKKLIQIGHDMPTAQQLRRDLAIMEQSPFDGLVVEVRGEGVAPDVNTCPFRDTFSNTRWERAWFLPSIADLQAIRPQRLTANFLNVLANPGNVDWFDDDGWANIADHFRIAAWVAKEGHLTGIMFDPEPYVPPYRPFDYRSQPLRSQHSFDEYYAKARQRGQEVMQAIVSEYPDMVIATHFMYSYLVAWDPWLGPSAAGLSDPRHALRAHAYGLYAGFMEGWLDAAPPTVTFVDGDERSYEYADPSRFWHAAAQIKGPAQEVISPENRAKYRSQVQVSSAIYLDAYPFPQHRYWLGAAPEKSAAMLHRNLAAALEAADEYVRVYGESGRWWPDPGGLAPWPTRPVHPPWSELMPGVEQALRDARDPQAARLRALLAEERKLVSLARNGDFFVGPSPASLPAEWTSWQEDNSQGAIGWDATEGCLAPGAARLSNVTGGCLIQTYQVNPGERYLVRAMARRIGEGLPSLSVGWKTPGGKWLDGTLADRFRLHPEVFFPEEGAPDAWRELDIEVATPDGAAEMIVMPGISGQSSPRDVVWFDDIRVYRLP